MIIAGTEITVNGGNPSVKILVLARTYAVFEEWCRSHSINRLSKNVVYVRSVSDFKNQKDVWVKDLGVTADVANEFYNIVWANEYTGNFREIR